MAHETADKRRQKTTRHDTTRHDIKPKNRKHRDENDGQPAPIAAVSCVVSQGRSVLAAAACHSVDIAHIDASTTIVLC